MKETLFLILGAALAAGALFFIDGSAPEEAVVIHPSPAAEDSAAAMETVKRFISAIDRLHLEELANSFAPSADAFYPFSFTPARLDGREAIRQAQDRGFSWVRGQMASSAGADPARLHLNPTDMHVQMLGEEAAVITWHSNRPGRVGRRTAVLHRTGGQWLIYHHHASNMPLDE